MASISNELRSLLVNLIPGIKFECEFFAVRVKTTTCQSAVAEKVKDFFSSELEPSPAVKFRDPLTVLPLVDRTLACKVHVDPGCTEDATFVLIPPLAPLLTTRTKVDPSAAEVRSFTKIWDAVTPDGSEFNHGVI
jgi:hypothetical protein